MQFDVSVLLRFATSPCNEVRSMARNAVWHFAELLSPFQKKHVPAWKEKVMEMVGFTEGERLPRCEQPSSKTFSGLFALKKHDNLELMK
jgi:hypothetical protein